MLGKIELAKEVEARTGVKVGLVKHVFDAVADIALEQIKSGNDFKLPGVAKVVYRYSAPYKKGEKYVDVFTKEEKTREKSRKASIRIAATPEPKLKREVKGMSMSSRAAKAVVGRKTK